MSRQQATYGDDTLLTSAASVILPRMDDSETTRQAGIARGAGTNEAVHCVYDEDGMPSLRSMPRPDTLSRPSGHGTGTGTRMAASTTS